jgi:hypothetical protein
MGHCDLHGRRRIAIAVLVWRWLVIAIDAVALPIRAIFASAMRPIAALAAKFVTGLAHRRTWIAHSTSPPKRLEPTAPALATILRTVPVSG